MAKKTSNIKYQEYVDLCIQRNIVPYKQEDLNSWTSHKSRLLNSPNDEDSAAQEMLDYWISKY